MYYITYWKELFSSQMCCGKFLLKVQRIWI